MNTPDACWAVLWHSENKLDGIKEHLIYRNQLPILFRTRREARQWIDKEYVYIKSTEELRAEPYGWRLPRAIKVKIIY